MKGGTTVSGELLRMMEGVERADGVRVFRCWKCGGRAYADTIPPGWNHIGGVLGCGKCFPRVKALFGDGSLFKR